MVGSSNSSPKPLCRSVSGEKYFCRVAYITSHVLFAHCVCVTVPSTSPLCVCSSLADCKNNTVAEEQKQLAWLVMETLTVLLQGSNNTNAGIKKKKTLKEVCVLLENRWRVFKSNFFFCFIMVLQQ